MHQLERTEQGCGYEVELLLRGRAVEPLKRSRRSCGARLRMREATNAPLGSRRQRIQPDSEGALAVTEHLLAHDVPGGAYTPATLIGPDLVARLPGSGPMQIA